MKKAIKTLKNNYSSEPIGIGNAMIKYGSEKLHRILGNMVHRRKKN